MIDSRSETPGLPTSMKIRAPEACDSANRAKSLMMNKLSPTRGLQPCIPLLLEFARKPRFTQALCYRPATRAKTKEVFLTPLFDVACPAYLLVNIDPGENPFSSGEQKLEIQTPDVADIFFGLAFCARKLGVINHLNSNSFFDYVTHRAAHPDLF